MNLQSQKSKYIKGLKPVLKIKVVIFFIEGVLFYYTNQYLVYKTWKQNRNYAVCNIFYFLSG